MAKLLIKTFQGLEAVLADELRALGAQAVQPVSRGVICEGDPRLLYRANLELRTGLRVYRHVFDCAADDPDALYYGVGEYDWSSLLRPDGTLYVSATAIQTEWIRNTMILSLKTKDAIVDKLRRGETRPQVDRDRPDIRVHAYVYRGQGSIWLDSTGDPLFKRGYRLRSSEAPINEVLAAGILALAGYRPTVALVDPMCGGGTFAIEAARQALNIPAQSERKFFAFMNWPDYDEGLWRVVRQQGLSRIRKEPIASIIASDRDWRAMRAAQQNVREAGLARHIELHEASFFDVGAPSERGLVIFNPPYDQRLDLHDGLGFYREIGTALKHDWTGWDAWIVSGFIDGLHELGLTPKHKFKLDNGGIPVELWEIPLYAGSQREPRADAEPLVDAVRAGGDDTDDEAE